MTKYYEWLRSVPVGISLCTFGIIGNVLSIFVWLRVIRRKITTNKSTSIYLIALCTIDSFFLLFTLLVFSIPEESPKLASNYYYAMFYCYFGFPMYNFCMLISLWFEVGVTVNRFIMAKFPLEAQVWNSERRTYCAILAILFSGFVISVPWTFMYEPIPDFNDTNAYSIEMTNISLKTAGEVYRFWLNCVVLVIIPWMIVSILNFLILHYYTKVGKMCHSYATTERQQLIRNKKEKHMTKVILVVTTSFLVTLAWNCTILCIYKALSGEESTPLSTLDITNVFAPVGVMIKSSINFVLYSFSSSLFRNQLRSIFRNPKRSNKISITPSTIGIELEQYS